jgi:perosamine synthetase
MYKPDKLILTAGPSISQKEIKYVLDAVENGWNEQFNYYLKRFEKAFAEYVGVKYAWATSSGTGALHAAILALDLKKGDEVIIPEITFAASANVVAFAGATPVFVDVERDTWTIDPKDVEKKITKKTKAIMPVHIYGNVADMDPIKKLAKKYNLKIIEDACPAVGAEYKGKKTGNLSDVAAFSFQGAKIMVTGEGGMLVTNDANLYDKARYWGDNAKDKDKTFWHTDVAYMYRMANLLAALGLGQLERNDTFIAKKRKIFSWYKKRLGNIEGLSMNVEKEGTKSIYWMSSIVLDRDFGVSREELMAKLKTAKVDTRPFFYPVSMFPMWKEQKTPNAHHIGTKGINLPSGINLTEEKVDYIASTIKRILKV